MLVLPNKTSKVWNRFLKENKTLIYKYIVRKINKGIQDDSSRVDLFKLENDQMYAFIPKEKYIDTLEDALNLFVKEEEYESAAKVKDIMVNYHIDKLIKESKTTEE